MEIIGGMMQEPKTEIPLVDLKAQYASIREEIQFAVEQVLVSGQYVGGEALRRFEDEFSRYTGAVYTVGVSSGTDALELALKVARIGPGDDVIVPANSFFATAEAVSNVGARPVFADVDPVTLHLSVTSAANVLTSTTRAVIPVHLYGRAMDLTELVEFADAHHLEIIEDAAQAHGVGLKKQTVGSSGRLCCFSFYPGKNLGAYGEAGAVTTSDPEQAKMLRMLRDHGSLAKYEHAFVGKNARMDALQGAILSVKLKHLSAWNELRYQHALYYDSVLGSLPMTLPEIPAPGEHNFHLYVIRVGQRDELRRFFSSKAIGCGIHYPIPIHLTEAYQRLGVPGIGSLPVCEAVSQEILSLPMYPELSLAQMELVAEALREFSTCTPAAPTPCAR